MTDTSNLRIQPPLVSSTVSTIVSTSGILLFAHPAFAHPGHGLMSFLAGLAHPMTGLDHILTALAIGILAVSSPQKVNLKIPLGFITAVTCGIFAGQMGLVLPFYDQGIAISLALIGICLFFGAHFTSWKGVLLVACFGVFHGNAHGAELQNGGISLSAAMGLLVSTCVLLGVGTGLAVVMRRSLTDERAAWVLRLFGAGLVGTAFVL
jgi:urease accessory protein